MEPFRRVLVAVGDPGSGSDVLPYARLAAALLPSAEFHLVHVADPDDPRGRAAVDPVCRVIHGDRVDTLLEQAVRCHADLLLLGHRPGSRGRRSLARRLAMKAPCSLWMAPGGSAPRLARVLAGVDFSDNALHALATAAHLARAAGLPECTALHVAQRPRRGLHRALERHAGRVCPPGFAIRLEIDGGPAVADASRRLAADLVVVGSRGSNPATAVLLGSESDQLLRESAAPVLVTSPAGAREGLVSLLLDRPMVRGAS